MTRKANHRLVDIARAMRAAARDPNNWQVELLPNGAICIVPHVGAAQKTKRLPPPVAHA